MLCLSTSSETSSGDPIFGAGPIVLEDVEVSASRLYVIPTAVLFVSVCVGMQSSFPFLICNAGVFRRSPRAL